MSEEFWFMIAVFVLILGRAGMGTCEKADIGVGRCVRTCKTVEDSCVRDLPDKATEELKRCRILYGTCVGECTGREQ